MSDLSRTIEIIFNGTDSVSDTLDTIGRNVSSFGNDLGDIGKPFADAALAVGTLELAILGLGAAALKARSDIESETTKMQNALGLPAEKVSEFSGIAEDVFKNAFTGTIEEAFAAVTTASQKFKDASTGDLTDIVNGALKLSDTFDVDYSEVLSGVSSLMNDFGLDSEAAFDFITKGMQDGLNGSGDLIDSLGEYGQLFADAGASSDDLFGVLKAGYDDSILGTDKVADAFKEFGIKVREMADPTAEALKGIGIDPDKLQADLASGKTTIFEVFNDVIGKIDDTTNSTDAFKTGVALLGTPFEDLGVKAVGALADIGTEIDGLDGAMSRLKPDESLGKKFEQAMNTVKLTLTQASFWDGIESTLGVTFDDIKTSFEEAFAKTDFSEMETAFDKLMTTISDMFVDMDLDITTVDGMANAIDLVVGGITGLTNVSTGIVDTLTPIVDFAKTAYEWFTDLSPETQTLIGKIAGLGTELAIVGGIVSTGGALLSGLSTFAGLFGSGSALSMGITGILGVLSGPAGLAIALGALATAVVGISFAGAAKEHEEEMKRLEDHQKAVDDLIGKINELPADATTVEIFLQIEQGDLEGAQKAIDDLKDEELYMELWATVEREEVDDFLDDWNGISEEKGIELAAKINQGDVEDIELTLEDLTGGKEVSVKAKAEVEEAMETITATFEDHRGWHKIEMEVPVNASGVDDAKAEIESIPTEKMLEIKLQGDIDTQIATIIAQAETVQTAMEWSAKVDIAEAEAGAEEVKAAFEAASDTVGALSDTAGDMFDALANNITSLDIGQLKLLKDIIEEQMEMEEQALESQIKLSDAQAAYMTAKAESLARGDGQIKIDSTGLEPALELVMWQIIDKVQVAASMENADFLLGI